MIAAPPWGAFVDTGLPHSAQLASSFISHPGCSIAQGISSHRLRLEVTWPLPYPSPLDDTLFSPPWECSVSCQDPTPPILSPWLGTTATTHVSQAKPKPSAPGTESPGQHAAPSSPPFTGKAALEDLTQPETPGSRPGMSVLSPQPGHNKTQASPRPGVPSAASCSSWGA